MSGGVLAEVIRTLLTMSIIGTILSGLLFALKPVIKNRMSKAFQYYIWVAVLAAFIIPFSVNIQLSGEQNIVTVRDAVQRYIIMPEGTMDYLPATDMSQGTGQIVKTDTQQPAGNSAESLGGQIAPTIQDPASLGTLLFFVIWLFGAFAFLGIRLLGYFRFVHALRSQNVLFDTREKCKVYKNPLVSTPMLIGVFRPVIMLPDREYDTVTLEHILRHELTHLRRQDILIKWLAVLANAVHWFNPVVYFVRREISRACELSCDEAVIRELDMNGKQEYGDTLIAVVAESRYPAGVVSTTMCEEKKTLKERLSAIMQYSKKGRLAVALSAVLLVVICAGAVFAGANVERGQKVERAKEPAQTEQREQFPTEQEFKQMAVAQLFAEYALEELKDSITYVEEDNIVRFVMPKALPEGYMLYVKASGKVKIGNREAGMFRWFYTQDKNGLLELGKTYEYQVERDLLSDELIVAGLLSGSSASALVECWTLVGFDENGNKEIKSAFDNVGFELFGSGELTDKELVEFADLITNRQIADFMTESSQVGYDGNAGLVEPIDKTLLADIFPDYDGTEALYEWKSIKGLEMRNHVLSEIDGILQMHIGIVQRYNNSDIKLAVSAGCFVKDQGPLSYRKGSAQVIVEMIRSDMLNDKKVQITAEDILEIRCVSYNRAGETVDEYTVAL